MSHWRVMSIYSGFAIGQKLCLVENSKIPIFSKFSVLEGKKRREKKGVCRLGRGFEIGLN